MVKQRAKLKKIVFFGFFVAFLFAFLSVNNTHGFWGWFKTDGNDNVAATTASSKTYTLKINKSGSSAVISSDGKINCGLDCSEKYNSSPIATVTLTAVPASGHSFNKWEGGGCGGSEICTVKITKPITITAKFKKKNPQETSKNRIPDSSFGLGKATTPTYKLKVTIFGKGRIKDNFSKMDCSSNMTCEATYSKGQVVRIKTNDMNSSGVSYNTKVESWDGGGCSGASNYCDIKMNGDKEVRVNFITKTSITYKLKITVSGNGRIQDNYSKIDCGSNMTCQGVYPEGRMIKIKTDSADSSGASFGTKVESWDGGGCSGTSDICEITMDGNKEVTIKFVSK